MFRATGQGTQPCPSSREPDSTCTPPSDAATNADPPGGRGERTTLATPRHTVPSMHFSRPLAAPSPHCPRPHGAGMGGGAHGQPTPPRITSLRGGWWAGRGGREDAQAGMPLDEPRAQVAFKDSMIRGILQFTLRIAFRCVLHRCKSQDIRC